MSESAENIVSLSPLLTERQAVQWFSDRNFPMTGRQLQKLRKERRIGYIQSKENAPVRYQEKDLVDYLSSIARPPCLSPDASGNTGDTGSGKNREAPPSISTGANLESERSAAARSGRRLAADPRTLMKQSTELNRG